MRWLLWIAIPVVCVLIDPQPHRAVNSQLTLIDMIVGVWGLVSLYFIHRGYMRWRGRQLSRGWHDEIQRRG